MSTAVNNTKVNNFIIFSAIFHCILLVLPAALPKLFDFSALQKEVTPLKIHSLRTIGDENSKFTDRVLVKPKSRAVKKSQRQALSTKQLAPMFAQKMPKEDLIENKKAPSLQRSKAIKALSLNRKSIKGFLKNTPQAINSRQFLNALGDTSSVVKLEVPKGVKEDELNKHELVFYSFQKRTALNYINSFYKKLNEFELQNPHLKFPLTEQKQKMVGRVIYDKDGNIIKINVLKWANVPKLQSFFLNVLKEMTSLPNPPDQILKDDQFTVFYALTIND